MADDNLPVETADTSGQSLGDSRSQAIAQAIAGAKSGEIQAQTTEGSEPEDTSADPWGKHEPKFKPMTARERFAQSEAKRQAAQQANSLQAQYDQLQAKLSEVTSSEQRAMNEFQAHLDKGDVEAALKVKGLPVSFEDLQRAKLKALGAISDTPKDPRVDALQKELEELKSERAKQQEAARQRQEQAARQREWQEGIAQVKSEIEALDLPGAKELTSLEGFNEMVLKLMQHSPQATLEECAYVARRDYKAWYDQLSKAFEVSSPVQQAEQQPAGKQTLAQSVASRSKPRAPNPLQNIPDNVSLKDRRAQALAMALRGRA